MLYAIFNLVKYSAAQRHANIRNTFRTHLKCICIEVPIHSLMQSLAMAHLLNVFAFVSIFFVLLFSILCMKQSESFTALFGYHDIGLEQIEVFC